MAWDWTLTTEDRQITFGDDENLFVVDSWSVEPGKLRVDDREVPRGDGLRFGQDFRAGQVASFSLWVNGGDEATASAALSEFGAAWRNDTGRRIGGAMATLRHPQGRCAYGRPRGFTPDSNRIEQGWAKIKAEFECVDELWYGPEEVTEVSFVPPATGGLEFPAEAPFTFDSGPTVRNGSVIVSGDVASWPVFEILGPVANPEIDIIGVGRLVFRTTLAADQFLVVDTRPWARWVKRGYASNPTVLAALPGALDASGARLSDVALQPGAYSILLRGYDTTGTAKLRVRCEPAFTSF
ncbi:phage tail family protein [Leucobacter allii]|uniref:Phage tail family protein n=1 Tax=Leucobacter allii TaxID=2932247 RepID=A0ABY4FLU6_9MICO|nr:phage tail family protein [Leucobacter allii]UOQ57249.1 phage tail family protein [Leucobacter allii]